MSILRVQCFTVSIDGYSAGPNQSLQNPLGINGFDRMQLLLHTREWQQNYEGKAGGEMGIDNRFAEHGFAGIGARILGIL